MSSRAGQDSGGSAGCGKHPKRRKWLPHEDEELCRQVKVHGKNWPAVAENLENRDASGCRKRFVNYLEQVLYKGEWTPEEDAALLKAYSIHGNHWSQIAKEGILNRRSARALGWRWAKVFARKVSVVETQSRRHHPYKRPCPPPPAAAAAAPAPVLNSEPSPVDECAEAIHPTIAAASAAVAASSPFPVHVPAHAQSELISLLVRLETQKIVRALSLLLATWPLPRQEPEQLHPPPSPEVPEVWQPPPPQHVFLSPMATWDASDAIESRLPVETDDSSTIRLLGEDIFST